MDESEHKQRVYGAILGQAIGDAMGAPLEGAKSESVDCLNVDNHFTDDTQMMVAVAAALLARPPHRHGGDEFMTALGAQFVSWLHAPLGGSHRGPGGACLKGCHNLDGGKNWQQSGGTSAKGNGSAMRSSVVGALYWRKPSYAFRIGCLSSVPTHNNLEPILVAGMVACVVAMSIKGHSFPSTIARTLNQVEYWNQTVPSYPHHVPLGFGFDDQNPWHVAAHIGGAFALGIGDSPVEDFASYNGDDFAAVPALSAAVFYNARYTNYAEIVLGLANGTGDSDTTAAIGGAIAGARFGLDAIPQDWRQSVEMSDHFHDLAARIWDASRTLGSEDAAVVAHP